jgi:DNA-binding transcriptional MerR regulator
MGIFGKKKEQPKQDMNSFDMPMPQQQSAMEQVQSMRQQGYSNNQIMQALQGQGFNPLEISDAMNQANASGNFQGQMQPEPDLQDYGHYETYGEQPSQFQPQGHDMPPMAQMQPSSNVDEEKVQQIVEAVIDEKWEEFAKDVKKIIEWKEKSEDRMAKLEQQLIDMRLSMDSLTKSIIAKISSYDQNIVDVGTEIKAMEKVFQKVLPSLTENVNKLERMSKDRPIPTKK